MSHRGRAPRADAAGRQEDGRGPAEDVELEATATAMRCRMGPRVSRPARRALGHVWQQGLVQWLLLLVVLLRLAPTSAYICVGSAVQATGVAIAPRVRDIGPGVWDWLQSESDDCLVERTRWCISLAQLAPPPAVEAVA